MAVNIETAISNMYALMNRRITYSMYGCRTGNGCSSADCSGAIYDSLRKGGMPNAGWVLNTDSMHDWLTRNGWSLIAFNKSWNMQRGDVIIFGYKGSSGGAAGHVAIAVNNNDVIHCNYSANGVSVNNEAGMPYSMGWYVYRPNQVSSGGNKPAPVPPQPSAKKNGIAIDNISYEQAKNLVPYIQSRYAWTLARDQIKRVLQPNKVYTLVLKCDNKYKLDNTVNRLKGELKSYFPQYMQQNIVIIDGDKKTARIEARNLTDAQSKKLEDHMRKFNCDITLYDQTFGQPNSYGTWDVRVMGEGFNNTDAPIVLREIQDYAAKLKVPKANIKGFQY